MKSVLLAIAAVGCTASAAVWAQAPAAAARTSAAPVAFEVASVKTSESDEKPIWTARGRRFSATNIPLRGLMRIAFGTAEGGGVRQLPDDQLIGGPAWIASARYDIVADGPDGAQPPGAMLRMLQSLLADRFKLAAHHETRELPVYALVAARRDGTLGARLRPAEKGAVNALRAGPGRITSMGTTIGSLADTLRRFAGRGVVDETGLTGYFAIDLEWAPTPDQQTQRPGGAVLPVNGDGPSLFTALQEQLGLKLEPRRGPVDVLVLDAVHSPAEN
jgi:uncharacterized protein (TIGR03435 family)